MEHTSLWIRIGKVEKTLKGSLDLISSPSPSWKIQIMGCKVCLKSNGKTLLGTLSTNFLYSKVCWKYPAMFCLYTFPAHNLIFHWRCKVMELNPGYLLNSFFYFKKLKKSFNSIAYCVRWRILNYREFVELLQYRYLPEGAIGEVRGFEATLFCGHQFEANFFFH